MSSVITTVLGSRGSVPVSGKKFSRYGGATSCVVIRTGEGAVILDAGTGILSLSSCLGKLQHIPVFLSHCHVDHILGLPLCSEIFDPANRFTIYGASRSGKDIASQVSALLSPPLWPVGVHELPAGITFSDLPSSVTVNGITVESMEGNHPGGVSIFRVTAAGKQIVYMTDCTITDENRQSLLTFCRGCDLLLCDGQYSDEQWPACAAFGHNRWTEAARFALKCDAKLLRILHHAPNHTDDELDNAERQAKEICPACAFSFDGEEITL